MDKPDYSDCRKNTKERVKWRKHKAYSQDLYNKTPILVSNVILECLDNKSLINAIVF